MHFFCISCDSIVYPNTRCTGRWHQQRKSKHMGVIELSNNVVIPELIYKKYFDLVVYIRCYGYGTAPLPYGLHLPSDLYWE